ncbi:hypothetical protein BHM03_00046653 [Ensete ventricosum]|nr:hypothetical protein BHM03_00046653 [Ensete ventricosum]
MAVHVKLLAADLLSLAVHHASRPPSFTRKGKPVSRAEAVGVVVSRERKHKYLSFLLDDGSGCIPCILWLNDRSDRERDLGVAAEMAREEAAAVQLGKLVRVRGRITAYRGVVQITVGDVVVERDPNAEVLHWLDCVSTYTTAPTHAKHRGKEEEYDPDLLLQVTKSECSMSFLYCFLWAPPIIKEPRFDRSGRSLNCLTTVIVGSNRLSAAYLREVPSGITRPAAVADVAMMVCCTGGATTCETSSQVVGRMESFEMGSQDGEVRLSVNHQIPYLNTIQPIKKRRKEQLS